MNFKTLALASLFVLAAGIASAATPEQVLAEEQQMTNVIQDVNQDKFTGRYYGTKQGSFYQYPNPNEPGRYYHSKWWEGEETAPCGDCGRCNVCAPACPTC